MPRRRIVAAQYAGGAAYTWHDDQVHIPEDHGGDLLEPESEDPVTREIRAFRSAIEGTGPRMVDDERLSIGIGRLLDEVGRSVVA